MAKKVIALIKLHIPAGKATPAPPVGPALGQHGVNIMDFCKAFNAKTQKDGGMVTPVVIKFRIRRNMLISKYLCALAALEASALHPEKCPRK